MQRVDILGVQVACVDQEGLFTAALDWACQTGQRTICYANAHTLNTARENPRLRSMLNQSDLVYADGISVVWAARYLSGVSLAKLTGRCWIRSFLALAARQGLKLFLFGGRPGVAEMAGRLLQIDYPGLHIAGCISGFFEPSQEAEIIRQVNLAQPEILLVGLGTPRQEEWLFRNRQALKVPLCWVVGALFDYLTGLEKEVPAWLDCLGFEWFWRLLLDPVGKWKRYLLGNPRFIWRVLRQKSEMRG